MYDDRDYDDIMGMVTDGAGVNDARVPHLVRFLLADIVHPAVTRQTPIAAARRQTIRGPPTEQNGHGVFALSALLRRSAIEHSSDRSPVAATLR
jgi:hypothetical protein